MDRHEDEDVIADQIIYVHNLFSNEIYEHCWIQIPQWKYGEFKYKEAINHMPIKKEKEEV